MNKGKNRVRRCLVMFIVMAVVLLGSLGANRALAFEGITLRCEDSDEMQVMVFQIPAGTQGTAWSFGVNPNQGYVIEWSETSMVCITDDDFCTGFAQSIRAENALPISESNQWLTAQVSSAPVDLAAFKRLGFGSVSVRLTWCTGIDVFPNQIAPQFIEQSGDIELFTGDLEKITIQPGMPGWMQGAIRLAAWLQDHPDAEPEDVPFTQADKVSLKPMYIKFHPDEFPIEPTYELIDGGFNVGTFRRNGGNADLLRAVGVTLKTENPACVIIDEQGISSLDGVGISFLNTNVPGSGYIEATAYGFGAHEGKLLAGRPLLDISAEVQGGTECKTELARTVTVQIKKAVNELKVDIPVKSPTFSIILPFSVPAGLVHGKTTLQFRERTAGRVLVKITCPGGHMDSTSPANDGTWQIAGVPAEETCIVIATAPGYLSAQGEVTGGSYGVAMPTNELLGGDANRDGVVALTDITEMIAQFAQPTENCEIEGNVYDVDCNGVVALNDITVAKNNFGKNNSPW